MRVRITRPMKDSVDGIDLTHLHVGSVYDVSAALGIYLMACGHAQAVAEETPARVMPREEDKGR